MPVAAPLVGAAVGIGGAALSASASKKAANKAAAAQTAANDAAIAEQQRQYNTTRSDLSPWVNSGSAAQQQINALLGIGPERTVDWTAYVQGNPDAMADWQKYHQDMNLSDYGQYHYASDGSRRDLTPYTADTGQQGAIDKLKASPLYQSLFSNGENTLLANASATGGLRGGNTNRGLADFGRDTLSAVIQNQLQNLTGVAAAGQNAAAQTGTFGANSANNISNLLSGSGKAQSTAALQSGAASASAIGDITKAIGGLTQNKDVTSWVGKLF